MERADVEHWKIRCATSNYILKKLKQRKKETKSEKKKRNQASKQERIHEEITAKAKKNWKNATEKNIWKN